jgi:hypothetical protein
VAAAKSESAMTTNKTKATDSVPGWYADTAKGQFEIGVDPNEKHSGTQSAYIKSIGPKSKDFGNLMQCFHADEYRGQHFRMSAWVKTRLDSGSAQLWVRVDGEGHGNAMRNCFDNMGDRPIKGNTDWKQYSVVVDIPESSSEIVFGCFLFGTGQVWFDDVTIESVSRDVPLTGNFTSKTAPKKKLRPSNLDFEGSNSKRK